MLQWYKKKNQVFDKMVFRYILKSSKNQISYDQTLDESLCIISPS